jgi:poly-gamma-glutamate synthesis protein (capsule biosynthesis protein)
MLKISKKKYIFIILPIFFLVCFFSLSYSLVKSGEFLKDKKNENIPSQILIENNKSDIEILFLGDLMFDRYIRQTMERRGDDFILEKVEKIFANSNLIVGNLEGPITENQSLSINSKIGEKNNYLFTFDPKIADFLNKKNIKLVSIGNNHITNFGQVGVDSTKKYLENVGVKYFGDPSNEKGGIIFQKIGGFNIAFISYNQFSTGAKKNTLGDIAKAKNAKADLIILYAHWGSEFQTKPNQDIINLAHEFIDQGTDLIIGSHPHVTQTVEQYKGRTIYYSLGNFIFDQYFEPNTKKGMAVKVQINSNKEIKFQNFSIKMEGNGQTSLE